MLALAIAGIGVICGILVTTSTRSLRDGLLAMLELWVAGGLLRLSAESSWAAIGTAAVVILLRKVLSYGVATSRTRRTISLGHA